MFFDENGILDMDALVAGRPSYRKIMEDGTVTEEEVKAQSDRIVELLHGIERDFTQEQQARIRELLAETSVLYAAYQLYSIQSLDK